MTVLESIPKMFKYHGLILNALDEYVLDKPMRGTRTVPMIMRLI